MPNLQRQAELAYYTDPPSPVSITTSGGAPWGYKQALFGVGEHLYLQTDSREYGMGDITGYPGLLSFSEPCVCLFLDLERTIFEQSGSPENAQLAEQLVARLKDLIGLVVRVTPYTENGERLAYIQVEFTAQTIVRSNRGQKMLGTLGDLTGGGIPPISRS